MLQIVIKFVTQNALKAAGVWMISHGIATADQWTAFGGIVAGLIGWVWHWHETHAAAVANGSIPAPASPALPPKLMQGAIVLLFVPALLLGGCMSKDIAHVWTASGDGTKIGLTQNPATQAYELGVSRIHTHVTMIPIVFETNGIGKISAVIPDVVVSDEINARSGIFGGAGGTITVATGTNATQTLLGGAHVPINAGTGNNLPK